MWRVHMCGVCTCHTGVCVDNLYPVSDGGANWWCVDMCGVCVHVWCVEVTCVVCTCGGGAVNGVCTCVVCVHVWCLYMWWWCIDQLHPLTNGGPN